MVVNRLCNQQILKITSVLLKNYCSSRPKDVLLPSSRFPSGFTQHHQVTFMKTNSPGPHPRTPELKSSGRRVFPKLSASLTYFQSNVRMHCSEPLPKAHNIQKNLGKQLLSVFPSLKTCTLSWFWPYPWTTYSTTNLSVAIGLRFCINDFPFFNF